MKTTTKSNLISHGLALALAIAFVPAGAAPPPLTKDAYKVAAERIEHEAKAQRKACDRLKGHPKELCQAEAKGREKTGKAQLEARYKPSPDAEKLAKFRQAEAEYEVAKVRCAAARGRAKDACIDRAKHEREAAIRLAKVEKVEEVREIKAKAEEQKQPAARAPKPPSKS